MHRFFSADLNRETQSLQLRDQEAVHAVRVLRVRPGDTVDVLNGRGLRAQTRVLDVRTDTVALQVLAMEAAPPPAHELTLFQAVTKPKRMEWIIEKATELGTHCIQPVLSERVVSRPGRDEAPAKAAKWRRIAMEAIKQCGGLRLPRIEPPRDLPQALQHAGLLDCHLLAALTRGARELRLCLPRPLPSGRPFRAGIWIGPEGDFTDAEVARLVAAGAHRVTLGDHTLRSETAAVCTLALVGYELRNSAALQGA